MMDPSVRSEPPESIRIVADSTRGKRFEGKFSKVEKLGSSRMTAPIYHFDLQPNEGEEIPAEVSGERMVTVYKILDQEARIVPKAGFLFDHTEEIQRRGWSGLVTTLWPGARIIFIGPRNLAIVPAE